MLKQERRNQILHLLREQGAVTVTQIAALFDASEATVRRDLAALSQLGRVRKVHGGATLVSQAFMNREDAFEAKTFQNVEAKEAVARYAAAQIMDDDFVFIDAGSTTYLMTTFIDNTKARFLTNGPAHARILAQKGCRVFVLGGELRRSTEAIAGVVAASNLQRYNFSKAFLGTNGVSEKQGYTTPDTDEAMIKAVAIERSFVSYVLCDSSKINRVSAIGFAPIDAACLICDRCPDEGIRKKAILKEVDEA